MSNINLDVLFPVRHIFQKYYFVITSATVAGISYVLLKRYFAGGVCKSKRRLDGKTVIITGANSGIGKETAKDLAKRGARVILACRNLVKAERAASDIRRHASSGDVVVRHLDLSCLQNVRQFAQLIIETEPQVNILINNAGIMLCPKWKSADGYELQFAVNYLGHFLLTNLLLDLLQKSKPSRVITLSSLAHERGKIRLDDINHDKEYNAFSAYSQSKLANVLFTRELHKRVSGSGVCVFAVHPGVVKTELFRYIESSTWKKLLYAFIIWVVFKSSHQGAQTSIHCAVTEGLESQSGQYFSDCCSKLPAPAAMDGDMAIALWEKSLSMTSLGKPE